MHSPAAAGLFTRTRRLHLLSWLQFATRPNDPDPDPQGASRQRSRPLHGRFSRPVLLRSVSPDLRDVGRARLQTRGRAASAGRALTRRRSRNGDTPRGYAMPLQLGRDGAQRRDPGLCHSARNRPFRPGTPGAAGPYRFRPRTRAGYDRSRGGRSGSDTLPIGRRGGGGGRIIARHRLGGRTRTTGPRVVPRSELARGPGALSGQPLHLGARHAPAAPGAQPRFARRIQ